MTFMAESCVPLPAAASRSQKHIPAEFTLEERKRRRARVDTLLSVITREHRDRGICFGDRRASHTRTYGRSLGCQRAWDDGITVPGEARLRETLVDRPTVRSALMSLFPARDQHRNRRGATPALRRSGAGASPRICT